MVWHLATALFATMYQQKRPLPMYGQAALVLSRYCTYLMAYEPGLLPDDEAWTKKVYKDMVTELNSLFRSFCPAREQEEKSVIAKGVKLGKQVMEREQSEAGPSSDAHSLITHVYYSLRS
ncbi:hypothetical protein ZWY2020_015219 [Hordeum vulgare]|nr:hypothetical protein ZWY2020_015219 [Hordeum vulgare]